MINTIILGHALNVLPKLPAESVNCVTTSPPYWSLRDYGIEPVIWDGVEGCEHDFDNIQRYNPARGKRDGKGIYKDPKWESKGSLKKEVNSNFCIKCNAWRGSLGLEPTIELYIKHLCDIFDEVKRVLRKDGTCWVNLGDSYAGSGKGIGTDRSKCKESYSDNDIKKSDWQNINVPSKSLCLIPQRFVLEMVVNRGWIARNENIWHKPNCMPSSAKDRFTVDYEPVFFFSKSNKTLFWTNEKTLECVSKKPLGTKGIENKDWEWRPCTTCQGKGEIICTRCKGSGKVKYSFWTGHDYWFEQQFEEVKEETKKDKRTINGYKNIRGRSWDKDPNSMFGKMGSMKVNPQGRNKRCVWIIPTQPFPEAHFAVYPDELIEIPIKAGCPEFICKKCGKARVKILEPTEEYKKLLGKSWHPHKHDAERGMSETPDKKISCTAEYKFKGYSDCGCNAGFESGIVLDPFIGSGTTAKEALRQRKRFIGIDIKQEYVDMSYRKIAKVQQRIF